MLATPVMAIGPFNALDVGKNKNLEPKGPAVINHRGGEGSGVLFWMLGTSGDHWVKWEFQDTASQAKGIMNNAIIAEGPPSFSYFMTLAQENENKWIYLSGDGDYPSQFAGPDGNSHGMLWWFTFAITWATKYAEVIKSGGTPQAANAAGIAAGIAAGNADVAEHSAGVFWKTNEIKGSLP